MSFAEFDCGYKFAVDIKIEKRVLLFLFRTPFIFQVPQDIVV
jgi:hypothetical protein